MNIHYKSLYLLKATKVKKSEFLQQETFSIHALGTVQCEQFCLFENEFDYHVKSSRLNTCYSFCLSLLLLT